MFWKTGCKGFFEKPKGRQAQNCPVRSPFLLLFLLLLEELIPSPAPASSQDFFGLLHFEFALAFHFSVSSFAHDFTFSFLPLPFWAIIIFSAMIYHEEKRKTARRRIHGKLNWFCDIFSSFGALGLKVIDCSNFSKNFQKVRATSLMRSRLNN